MHATRVLDKTIRPACQSMHLARFRALKAASEAAQVGDCLSVTGLGRSIASSDEKMGIKRMDRLAGNQKLQSEAVDVYRGMAVWVVGNQQRPLIAIDWSPLKADNSLHVLRASLLSSGRGMTVYEEVHPGDMAGDREVQVCFIDTLARVLPTGCRPVLVTDGGFKNPWFRAVMAKGWDFVGRVRGTTQLTRPSEGRWVRCTLLGRLLERDVSTYLGQFMLARSNPLPCAIYGLKKPPKGRVDKTLRGERAQSKSSRTSAAREREPWLIATSLPGGNSITKQVIAAYRKRMQIEEAFRDTKNERYGLGLNFALSRTKERYTVLLLVAALAIFIAWILGKVAHQRNLHLRYQANTIEDRMVLSFVFLGMRIARRGGLSISEEELSETRAFLYAESAF